MEFYTIITDAGRAAVADAIATGGKVDLVQLAAGDGGGQAVQPVPSQQALAGEVWRGELSTYTVDGDVLTLSSFIPAEAMAFTLREMGVFTADGMLFAVCNTPEIRHVPPEEGVVGDLTLGMQLKISTLEQDALTIQTNPDLDFIPNREKGAAGGVAPLGPDGKVPEEHLPEMEYLPLAGGTMTGDINMGGKKLTNLAAPVSAGDAARKTDVDAVKTLAQGLFVTGEYTGDNSATKTLTFGFRPSLVIIGPRWINGAGMNGVWMLYPNSRAYSGNSSYDGPHSEDELQVKWNATGITMTDTNTIKYYNFLNEKYFYIAFR